MKKFYCFALVMLLSMTLCGIVAVAQTFIVDNIVYKIQNDGTAMLQKGELATGDVVIPAEVEYEGKKYSVVKVGNRSFIYNTAITSVDLPVSVNYIDVGAFDGCTGLVSITGGAKTFDYLGEAVRKPIRIANS